MYDYEELVAVIHDLGYTDFSVLYKLWHKDNDWMGAVKCDKGLRNVLVSNSENPVDIYVVERGKNSWAESEKVNSVKEHVEDDAEKCDADDEQGVIVM